MEVGFLYDGVYIALLKEQKQSVRSQNSQQREKCIRWEARTTTENGAGER